MKLNQKLGIGVVCIGAGLFGLTLEIDNVGHYFGTGTIFGIGLSLLSSSLYKKYKKGKKSLN